MQIAENLQLWIVRLDRRLYALLIGAAVGLIGALVGLLLAVAGPVITTGLIFGLIAGLYILTDLQAALYALVAVMILLPFGTMPFDIGFTPTLMDVAIGAFLLVYLMQWMTGRRTTLRLTPVHGLILIYMLWLVLSFALGLRYAPFTANVIRQFAATLLSISLTFIVVDVMRDPVILRRLVLVILLAVAAQALITLGLYVLPDGTAETLLNRLGRLGYPVGGVIRYIEANPALPERAIGTWIDPNSLGGLLAITATIIAPQVFAKKPVLRYRWLTFTVLALVGLALILTFSRASALALAGGLSVIAFVRYRRFIPLLVVVGLLLLLLPQTQGYIDRFIQAFTAQDLATQMRLGEYSDSLRLISRYPIFGVGFTGTPDIDIYTDVASMYLIMANQIGLVGLAIYLITIGGLLVYGLVAWQVAKHDDELDAIHLGYHAAVLAGLINAVADLYFFRLEYQGPITLFWLTITLAIASSRLSLERSATKSTVAKDAEVI
ncbi:MAG: O-antigen ligase family protein [Anaerolineae bacterium]